MMLSCHLRPDLADRFFKAGRIKLFSLLLVLFAGPLLVSGCSSADGTDLAPREEILKMLREQNYLFNKNVISTVYGSSQSQVVVSGQLARKTPDNTHITNGFKITQYRTIVVENINGTWTVTDAPPLQRDQFTSRERWKSE